MPSAHRPHAKTAVVTGASSGIGAATARRLASAGFHVVCAARRTDRVEALAKEIGGTPVGCDVTSTQDVEALAAKVGPRLDVLVNNAGGAVGSDPVAEADPEDWRAMYEVNVIGLLNVTKALLPALVASGDGVIVNVGSTAGRIAYEGGAGYTAAKHGTQVVTETLRLELCGEPVRITEIAPGMVRTDEFSLKRFDGDEAKAEAIYAGVKEPLVAEDIADAIGWVVTRPSHVNIDEMVIRPRAQAAQHKVHRVFD
ncbi:MAG TPA: SDR family NAD(P)-dependent oxidoreductase [Nocardioidaceae bacterium]|nr:SDR family NAD(P)-dependent oxidoreductase [Nocardioidaceae bacterium]